MIDKIRTEQQYEQVMKLIEGYIQKATVGGGFSSLTEVERDELDRISRAASDFERHELRVMPMPETLPQMLRLKMHELRLTQAGLAQMLQVSPARLSLIMNGKLGPGVGFLKAVYRKLQVDADFLLEHA